MNPQDVLLQQLRDIHGAPDVPWWPPAPGWWVLAVLVLFALFLLVRHARRQYQVRKRRERLLHYIEWIETSVDPQQAPGEFLSDLNRVFKLVALRAFPDSGCAELTGNAWVRFIDGNLPENGHAKGLDVLAEGPWQRSPEFEAEQLAELARRWVMLHG
ncbi:MAG: DUF4381 domain-containing protein [Xanthomonadales bacterium]|nr:DUF4381 domain-containing protein [Gammaproteobacteria bacterium]NNE06547.1 DUF4381 domain-containing protein [Xanthomonadales bacterium]NNL96377.1 DUF4381 domain-containing protein [Xanthomonadales bacterium]